ncbi:carbonic anhydrase precursor [mine drainage metagenome]|uniref:carbonic anhydrase n=1 Tax=mine drainage metagenome TaxID=410659 RepID=A0A1J5R0T3_9ZZZZ
MNKFITFLLLFIAMTSNSYAVTWVKLRDNHNSKLMLDKQSILEKDQLKRAWVKLEYKTPQKNLQPTEKEYNQSKLLWYFDCPAQKSATAQVFQYLNDDLVYSAAIDIKSAEFIEPVPETDVDIAMRHICMKAKPATTTPSPKKPTEKPAELPNEAAPPVVEKPAIKPEVKPIPDKTIPTQKKVTQTNDWTYEGKEGPENWGKLNPIFSTCDAGRNQSPIDIQNTTHASLKPLRLIQRYAVNDIVNNGHTIQANFKTGNMLILDSTAFLMKQVHFHAPSDNQINDKSYPLEAHFVHADSKGNLAVIAVMFKEGKANPALESLFTQIPHKVGEQVTLKSRVMASELMPLNRSYYRFSGSLTTPPCSEGVRWIVMKTPITASKEQISAFEESMKHHNNRPLQPLNGRVIVE